MTIAEVHGGLVPLLAPKGLNLSAVPKHTASNLELNNSLPPTDKVAFLPYSLNSSAVSWIVF